MPGPGDFLDPSLWPLFLQSGMMPTPPTGREDMSPATANLAGHIWRGGRQAQPASFPPYVQTPEELGQSAIQSAPMLMPGVGGMVARTAAAAPKTLAAVLGLTGLMNSTGEAGDSSYSEASPSRPGETQSAIDKLNTDIGPKRKQLDRLNSVFAGKQIDQKEYDRRRVPLEAEIGRVDSKIKELDAPFQRDLQAWETRKNDFLTRQATESGDMRAKMEQEGLPFRIKHPDATKGIIGTGMGLSGLTALMMGALSKGKLMPTVKAAGLTGIEGAATANIPEWLDLAGFQPIGSEPWKKTLAQQTSTENLAKTAAEAGVHGVGGGALTYGTSLVPKLLGQLSARSQGALPTLGTQPAGATAETLATLGPRSAPPPMVGTPAGAAGLPGANAPQSPPLMIQGSSGLWHYAAGSGKTGVVPKYLWPRAGSPPPMMGE